LRTKPHILRLVLQLSAGVFLVAVVERAVAQHDITSQAGVSLIKPHAPAYPPLARTARVTGDVKLQVGLRRDGTVSVVKVVSGHPLLNQAALESAQKSIFECRDCSKGTTLFDLTYTFVLRVDIDCSFRRLCSAKCVYLWKCGEWRPNGVARPIDVEHSQSHITITADSVCVETTYADLAKR